MSSFQFTTVNNLLLEECATFEYILLGDLRDLLEAPAKPIGHAEVGMVELRLDEGVQSAVEIVEVA